MATAEANKKLKKTPNFTDMAKSDMPTGRGRKGSLPPREQKGREKRIPGLN